jgi:hypothetical protein
MNVIAKRVREWHITKTKLWQNEETLRYNPQTTLLEGEGSGSLVLRPISSKTKVIVNPTSLLRNVLNN